jgi:hypothetical protein
MVDYPSMADYPSHTLDSTCLWEMERKSKLYPYTNLILAFKEGFDPQNESV